VSIRTKEVSVSVKLLFLETRPQFLVLSLVLAILASAMAYASGGFVLTYAALAFLGLLLLHVSVNTLNDYFDFKSGIDRVAQRTPFSGGSGFLPTGALKPEAVLQLGLGAFLLAVPIGVYFLAVRGTALLPLFLIGAVLTLAYTSVLTKIGWGVPEVSAGLGLGTLPVVGIYYILTGRLTPEAVYASVPSGLLVANLLLLNEFPDAEADKVGGRRTLPIQFGRRGAAMVYTVFTLGTYAWILGGVIGGLMPTWALLAWLTLPMGLKAIAGAFRAESLDELLPALGANVMVVLLTQFLLGVGYVTAVLVA